MLGLVTHVPNLFILREETLLIKNKKSKSTGYRNAISVTDNFELIHISLLREYLELEFSIVKDKIKFEYNTERIIDDFLFICFFIGNDFLPSLNTIDIEEGSLEKIFEIYKNTLPLLDDYITFHGKIEFKKAEVLFRGLAKLELDSLQSMLKKLEFKSREVIERRHKIVKEKKGDIKKKKIAIKKLKKFKEINNNYNVDQKRELKKKMVSKKINKLKESFYKEMEKIGIKNKNFEENVVKYKNNENIFGNSVKTETNLNSNDDNNTLIKENTHNNSKNESTNLITEDKLNLLGLFDSSDPESQSQSDTSFRQNKKKYYKFNKNNNKKYHKSSFKDTLNNTNNNYENIPERINEEDEDDRQSIYLILKNSLKFYNHMFDKDYISDFNINDLGDSDVSAVSDVEVKENDLDYRDGFDNKMLECQDFEVVFQQKLVNLYINNVDEAKKFYYSEKVKIDLDQEDGNKKKTTMFRYYLEGLQWVLFYYYRGIQSWKWYYPYHYPPMISDFSNLSSILNLDDYNNNNTKELDSSRQHYYIENVFKNLKEDPSDKPLLPFQSLLMILPKSSKSLLPQAYHNVYNVYPQYYPTNLIIDFNGKKLPWEALVIIPFIDQEKLINYEMDIRKKYSKENFNNLDNDNKKYLLSESILSRNVLGKTYIFSYDTSEKLYPNVINFKMFDFSSSYFNIKKEEYDINCDNIKTSLDYNYQRKIPSFKSPTISDIKFQYFQKPISSKTSRYGRPLRKTKTLIISPETIIQNYSENEALKFIEKSLRNFEVYVNFPYKSIAKIIGIIYYNKYYSINNVTNKLQHHEYKLSNDTKSYAQESLLKRGIYLEQFTSNIHLEIVSFDRYTRRQNGEILKIYQENDRYFVPIEITSLNYHTNTAEQLSNYYKDLYDVYNNISTEFKQNEMAILLTNTNYGSLVTIDGFVNKKTDKDYKVYNEANYTNKFYNNATNIDLSTNDWKIEINELYNGDLINVKSLPPYSFTSKIGNPTSYSPYINIDNIPHNSIHAILNKTQEYYITMEELAKKLDISIWTLSIISSCVYVVDSGNNDDFNDELYELPHWNLGLNIKSNKGQKLVLPGFTRYFPGEKNSINWEFSTMAVSIIEEYHSRFKFIFDALECVDLSTISRYFKISDLFKDSVIKTIINKDKNKNHLNTNISNIDGINTDEFNIKDINSKYSFINEDGTFNSNVLNDVSKWISCQEISGLGFANHNSNFVSKKDIVKIVEFINAKLTFSTVNKPDNNKISNYILNPNYLITEKLPYVERFRPYKTFSLGDRVANLRSDDKRFIPFGLMGVITGISEDFLEVLFDVPFFGGETCGGRLPEGRGMYVWPQNLLNLSKKAPVFLRRNKENFNPLDYKLRVQEEYNNSYFEYPLNKSNYTKNINNNLSNNNRQNYNTNNSIRKNLNYENEGNNQCSNNPNTKLYNNFQQDYNSNKLNYNNFNKEENKHQIKKKIKIHQKDDRDKTKDSKNIDVDQFFKQEINDNNLNKFSNNNVYYQEDSRNNYIKNNNKNSYSNIIKNNTSYNTKRNFNNENIKKNQIYYFGPKENYNYFKSINKNVI